MNLAFKKWLVEGKAVSRTFSRGGEEFTALDNASFRIAAADQIALTGRSGSGKSTLLNLVAGLDQASKGTLFWPSFGVAETLRPSHIAVMFQSLSLVPTLTVIENVALPLDLLGRATDREKLSLAALERFGLADMADKLPEELSGGQAQRVSLARATVTSPKLVIADEPTGQIDHDTSRQVMSALRDWADETGAALLVATHDSEVSAQFPMSWQMTHGRLSAVEKETAK